MRRVGHFIYKLLIAPSSLVERPEIQRRVILLSSLTLVDLLVLLFFLVVSFVGPLVQFVKPFQPILFITLMFHLSAYAFMRTRFYAFGGTLLSSTMFIGLLVTVAQEPILRVVVGCLPFLVTPALFAAFVLPFGWNLVVFIGGVSGTLIVPVATGLADNIVVTSIVCFNLTSLSTLLIGSYLKQLDTRQLAKERLQVFHSARMSTLGEMVGGVAHEVNNPITIIQLRATQALRILKQPEFDLSRMTECLEAIQKTTAHIEHVVKGLRSFSRTGDGDPFEEVEVGALLDDSLSLFGEQMRKDNIDVRISSFDRSLRVQCRPTQISQILINLYSNSKFALSGRENKWLEILVEDTAETVCISVIDNGSGIPSGAVRSIFEPFFTTKKSGEGTGFGLSISRSIARAHQGNLWHDVKHKNTRFVLEIRKKVTLRPRE